MQLMQSVQSFTDECLCTGNSARSVGVMASSSSGFIITFSSVTSSGLPFWFVFLSQCIACFSPLTKKFFRFFAGSDPTILLPKSFRDFFFQRLIKLSYNYRYTVVIRGLWIQVSNQGTWFELRKKQNIFFPFSHH